MTVTYTNTNVPEIMEFYKIHGLFKSKHDYAEKFKHLEFFNNYQRITIDIIQKYCTNRMIQGAKNSTINRELTIMRSAFSFYLKHKDVDFKNVFLGFKLFEDDVLPRFLSEGECKKLLFFAYHNANPMPHDYFLIMLNTGCRASELLTLEWKNVFLDDGYFVIRNSLSKNSRTIHKPINFDSKKAFQRLKSLNPKQSYVFYNPKTRTHVRSFYKNFKDAAKRARLGDLRVHDLRHTFASLLVQNGVPIYEVSTLLGHSDTRITQRYAHFAPVHLKNALNALPSFL